MIAENMNFRFSDPVGISERETGRMDVREMISIRIAQWIEMSIIDFQEGQRMKICPEDASRIHIWRN
jgi:hypothetical protein